MENASKALIMASVLLGIMIISIGVALFTSSQFGSSTIEKMEGTKIAEFNNQFLKYQDSNEVTAHDIISLANLALQNNIDYELASESRYNKNTYYIQIDVGSLTNLQNKEEKYKNEFLATYNLTQGNEIKYFKCSQILISEVTKRVMYVKFEEL